MPSTAAQSLPCRFTLGDWDTRAAVRSHKHTYLLPSDLERELETKDWFPPAFLPYLEHPTIEEKGQSARQRLAANHLVYFLDYTTRLEHKIVNRAVETIVHGELDIAIPAPMKTAALQLYTDEGYHALFSNAVAEQVVSHYGMSLRGASAQRINRLLDVIGRTPSRHTALAWCLIGFVSETIIARELLNITRQSLVSGVCEMLRDHLEDEARHSRYFCEVFQYLWPTLEARQRTFAADLLLEVITIFFEIDEPWLGSSLHSIGLPANTIADLLGDLSMAAAQLQRARSGATATLLAMKKAGFFDLSHNRLLFLKAGLIDG